MLFRSGDEQDDQTTGHPVAPEDAQGGTPIGIVGVAAPLGGGLVVDGGGKEPGVQALQVLGGEGAGVGAAVELVLQRGLQPLDGLFPDPGHITEPLPSDPAGYAGPPAS